MGLDKCKEKCERQEILKGISLIREGLRKILAGLDIIEDVLVVD